LRDISARLSSKCLYEKAKFFPLAHWEREKIGLACDNETISRRVREN